MTVTIPPRDAPGAAQAAKITARTTQLNTLAAGPSKDFANVKLDQDQQEQVINLMASGRLLASSILSTMT